MDDTIITVRNTVLEMLEDRGYDTKQIPYNMSHRVLLDAIKLFIGGMPSLDIYINAPRKIYVRFIYEIGTGEGAADYGGLSSFTSIIKESNRMSNNDEVVFVIFDKKALKDDAVKKINYFQENTKHVSVFYYTKLMFNISKHELVPKHSLLPRDKKDALIKKLMISSFNDLPIIYQNDPVCRYHGFVNGDVIKIQRPTLGNKEHIAYRYVTRSDVDD